MADAQTGARGTKPAAETSSKDQSVLVSGADTVANGASPAHLTIALDPRKMSSHSLLKLSVLPVSVSRDESYIVVVDIGNPQIGEEKQLGSFSFFPPPREGDVVSFLIETPKLDDKDPQTHNVNLQVHLVPAERESHLTGSSIRIVGASIVPE